MLALLFLGNALWAQTVKNKTGKPYTIQNVKFKSAETTLAGSIFLPKNAHAALVLIHGSGQEKRMLNLATDLAKQGIAILTYDKRGVGESGGQYQGPEVGTNNIDSANLQQLALDAAAAGSFMIKHLLPKQIPLGLMGFSQAGWIIPIAAQKLNAIKFMIIFSGPVVNTLEQLRFQFYTNGNNKFWDSHSQTDALHHIKNDIDRYNFTPTEPRNALSTLKINGLWIFGAKDIQIPVELSKAKINELKAEGRLFEYIEFPELGHNTSSSAEPMNKAIEWIRIQTTNKNRPKTKNRNN